MPTRVLGRERIGTLPLPPGANLKNKDATPEWQALITAQVYTYCGKHNSLRLS